MTQIGKTSLMRKGFTSVFKYGLFVLMILVWVFPVIWVILTSFKSRTDIFTLPPKIFFNPTFEHYIEAFLRTSDITYSLFNSIVVATLTTLMTLSIAVPAGYAFSRIKFRFRSQLSFFALMTQMSPPIGMIIPYFFILSRTNMLDSYAGLIAIHMTLTVPFSIWLMITYFQDIPVSLENLRQSMVPPPSARSCAWCCQPPGAEWGLRQSLPSSSPGTNFCMPLFSPAARPKRFR